MKNIKNLAYVAVVVLAVLAIGCLVWVSASYFMSLNEQVNKNTQTIQSIVQFLNQKTSAQAPSTATAPASK